MEGRILAYVRVSICAPDEAEQIESLQAAGVAAEQVFVDHAASDAHERPARVELLSRARSGDLVVVHSLGQFAWNLCDLEEAVMGLIEKGCRIRFVKEGLEFCAAGEPPGIPVPLALVAFAGFERDLRRERREEARAYGEVGGRPRRFTPEEEAELVAEATRPGANRAAVARKWGIGKRTFYRIMQRQR